jgi:phytoene dehydrogenase-like protein
MSEQQKSIIVIGAGMSGMATAAYAQMNGYKSTIFELHETPGGCCTAWYRKDFTFDWCISWLNGSGTNNEMATIWDELGCLKNVAIHHADIFNTVIDAQGNKIEFHVEPDKLEASLIELSPEDEPLIKEFCGYVRKLRGCMKHYPFLKSQGLMTRWEKAKMMWHFLPYMRTFMKTLPMTMDTFSSKFKNPQIAEAMNWIFYDRHDHFSLMPFAFNLACAAERNSGVPEIGSLGLSFKLADKVISLGGEIRYQSKVEEILVNNDVAVGVRLSDGTEHFADYVVAASDSYSMTKKLLNNRYPHPILERMYDDMKEKADDIIFPGCVTIFIAVDHDYLEHPAYNTYLLPDDVKSNLLGMHHGGLNVQVRNKLYPNQAPKGKSVLYISYLSDYEPWNNLSPEPANDKVNAKNKNKTRNSHTRRRRTLDYKVAKKDIGQHIVKYLEQYFDKLEEKVEYIDVSSPLTSERYTENHQGTIFAWQPFVPITEELEKYQDKNGPTLPNLANFYYTGQWSAHGGVTRSAASGRHIAQHLCIDDGKKFRVLMPELTSELMPELTPELASELKVESKVESKTERALEKVLKDESEYA